jgi:purine-binding chemotaxis protein CheW
VTETSEEAYDIRTILGKMREEYWQGLADQESSAEELLECLVFVLGGERYAFETQFATEVIRIPKLVRVPTAQSLIKGIFNLRGEITAAMDIRGMLELPEPELPASGRIIVVRSQQFATGILAEAALGVQGLSFSCYEPAVAAGSGQRRHYVRGHFNDDAGCVVLLDIEALLAAPEIIVGEAE